MTTSEDTHPGGYAVAEAAPQLCDDIPGAPRVETRAYFDDGTAFGSGLAEPLLLDDPALGRHILAELVSEDVAAIATRARIERTISGDEAAVLGAGYELVAGQLDVERNAHQVTVLKLEAEIGKHADATDLLAAALREQLRLQHLLTRREGELSSLRRKLAQAHEQVADAQLAEPTVTYVSYEGLVAQWAAQDRREQAELERLQRLHDQRSRFIPPRSEPPLVLDVDETMVLDVEVQP